MRGDTGVPCSSNKRLSTFDLNMFSSLYVFISFGESKIDNINSFDFVSFANHKVISLDISMYKSFAMDMLQTGDDLNADVKSSG